MKKLRFRNNQRAKQAATILSVHGKYEVTKNLAQEICDSSAITQLPRGLRNFRSKPHFDFIFYTPHSKKESSADTIMEDLCFCRMLLKPGASLYIAVAGSGNERDWLLHAGYMNIGIKKFPDGTTVAEGRRPALRL
ncbi:hypothetical protein UWK_00514 [Desulfocapsa sulfexigens DSM 10523]|uniref:Uncharacterized protein n=1 Tax=Desulfocapsa sulfexigens (strain DSM 10523 / SB164P1) TaxID=1167006 RepID=M1P5Y8_DESSD|nr:hypothetical protein [Desulfocapsa sulfexigens]AGF77097.1 hypothetical protein UWK_00514 [Desulfocapsa sulfexigens DSM 10523]